MNKPKKWIEWSIPSSSESVEAIENFLFENGCLGCEEKTDLIKAYFPENISVEQFQKRFIAYLKDLTALGQSVGIPRYKTIPSENWNDKWKSFFKPIQITECIVVKPPWSTWKPSHGQIIIDIIPKMAFGTGSHETTQLCLELLERYLRPQGNVLDVGTGSGILSIAAAKLGANKIIGLDIDENAIENARENIRLNHVEDYIEIYIHPIEILPHQIFDLLIANINRTTLMSLLPTLKLYSDDNSLFILSGILCEERSLMEDYLVTHGFQLLEVKTKGEWCGMVLQYEKDI